MVRFVDENQQQQQHGSSAASRQLQKLTSTLLNRVPLRQLDPNQQQTSKTANREDGFNKFHQAPKVQLVRKTAAPTTSAISAAPNRQIPPWLPSSRFNQLSKPPPSIPASSSSSSSMNATSFQPSARVRSAIAFAAASTASGTASTAAAAVTARPSTSASSSSANVSSATVNNNKRKLKLFEISAQEEARYENLAWLDMLLYLVESRYWVYALPITLDSHHFTKRRRTGASSSAVHDTNESSTSVPIIGSGSATLSASSYGYLNRFGSMADTEKSDSALHLMKGNTHSAKKRKLQLLQRHAKQIHDSSVVSSACCGCKTGCLKMYCVCFSARGFCHAKCSCANCHNKPNSNTRLEAIQNHLLNDPRAFANAAPKTDCSSGFQLLLPQKSSTVVLRGCRCKKSKCQKNYCECFQNNVPCTSHCRCVDCANHHRATSNVHTKSGLPACGKVTIGGANVSFQQHTAIKSSCKIICNESFREIQLLVTKKPKRNFVQKSIRMSL